MAFRGRDPGVLVNSRNIKGLLKNHGGRRATSRRYHRELIHGEVGSRPVSRVLSRTAIHLGVWSPIRSSDLPEGSASHAIAPYAVLLRMGFTLPLVLPRTRCALTAPFHPCQPCEGFGGVFSVALSVASRRPVVNRHPALWSPDFPLLNAIANTTQRLSSRLPAARLARIRTFTPGRPDFWLRHHMAPPPQCESSPQYCFLRFALLWLRLTCSLRKACESAPQSRDVPFAILSLQRVRCRTQQPSGRLPGAPITMRA
jgi:hypothetical protein